MTGTAKDDPLRTALVVLAVPSPGAGGHTTAGGAPTEPEGADLARNWFLSRGFQVDPVVGIAFAISGPAGLFRRTLGGADDGSAAELHPAELRGRVDDEVLTHLAAIVVGSPPDFGPGNP
jgi:hypothetical protein